MPRLPFIVTALTLAVPLVFGEGGPTALAHGAGIPARRALYL
jgi:hypothetical protein